MSLFDVDESGSIVYVSEKDIDQGDSDQEGDLLEDVGDDVDQNPEVGDLLDNQEDDQKDLEENQEIDQVVSSGVDSVDTDVSDTLSILSEDVAEAILAASPAGGSMASSTIDIFDRVVSGFPADYKYVAFRTNSDNSYDAVLYYGDCYDISGNMITFDTAAALTVQRSNSNYNSEIYYRSSEVSDLSVTFNQSGTTIYYTNAAVGYPLLGGKAAPKAMSFYLVPILIGVLVFVVLSELLLKR